VNSSKHSLDYLPSFFKGPWLGLEESNFSKVLQAKKKLYISQNRANKTILPSNHIA